MRDRHPPEHLCHRRDSFTGEIDVEYRGVGALPLQEFKGHSDAWRRTENGVARAPQGQLELHRNEELILDDQDLVRWTHCDQTFAGDPSPLIKRCDQTDS